MPDWIGYSKMPKVKISIAPTEKKKQPFVSEDYARRRLEESPLRKVYSDSKKVEVKK